MADDSIRFWGQPQPIPRAGRGRKQVEYLQPVSERWAVEVSREGLAELEADERDAWGERVEVDELRSAEHEWIEANAAAHGIDYVEAYRRGIAAGKIGAVR